VRKSLLIKCVITAFNCNGHGSIAIKQIADAPQSREKAVAAEQSTAQGEIGGPLKDRCGSTCVSGGTI
jgi:hypothetical protein